LFLRDLKNCIMLNKVYIINNKKMQVLTSIQTNFHDSTHEMDLTPHFA
jgi:hypothetical protein